MTFGRPDPAQQRKKRIAQRRRNLRALATPPSTPPRTAVMGGSTSGRPVEKGERAKPGKGAPTAAERAWLDWIVAYGCIACRIDGLGFRPPAVHHILRGGVRMGHLHTLPLCDPGHHQGGQSLGKVSRHPWKARFEQRYGTEESLLARLRAEYEGARAC